MTAYDEIRVDADDTPGDVFRKIGEWFDATGTAMPAAIAMHYHGPSDRNAAGEYAAVLAERFGVPIRTQGPERTEIVKFALHGGEGTWRDPKPHVTYTAFGRDLGPAED